MAEYSRFEVDGIGSLVLLEFILGMDLLFLFTADGGFEVLFDRRERVLSGIGFN